MKRREFIERTGCGVLAVMLAQMGLEAFPYEDHLEERKKKVKQMLMTKMGKTEEEAEAMVKELEEKLPMVKTMCICKTCPTYVKEDKEIGYCHPLIGKINPGICHAKVKQCTAHITLKAICCAARCT